jgi:hypothetical protein
MEKANKIHYLIADFRFGNSGKKSCVKLKINVEQELEILHDLINVHIDRFLSEFLLLWLKGGFPLHIGMWSHEEKRRRFA